jgi:hypothetical protein
MRSRKQLGKTQNGEFRVSIGRHLIGARREYKQFRLGKDQQAAEALVAALEIAWENETNKDADGEKVWSPENIDKAFSFALPTQTAVPTPVQIQRAAIPQPVFPHQPYVPLPKSLTLFQAIDLFVEELQRQVDGKEIQDAHRENCINNLNGTKRHISDVPLYNCDGEELWKMRRAVTARPMVRQPLRFKDGKPVTPSQPEHPISIYTVCNWLMTLGMAFDYFARTKRIGWKPEDIHWREAFCLTKSQKLKLLSPDEKDGFERPKPTFNLTDLTTIYKLACPYDRMLLLMGLTLGWTQKEIATFRKSHFVKLGTEYFIDKRRNKTGNEGYWWVCPELAQLLLKAISGTPANPDDLALLTDKGFPLIHGSTDNVKQRWDNLRYKIPAGTANYSFTRLRKLAGQMVMNISGSEELAKVMLAHAPDSVASKYYVGLDAQIGMGKTKFERLHECQKEIHKALKPMFDAALPKPKVSNLQAA